MNTPELSSEELERITRYRRPKKQLEILRSLGVPARLRPDNTVLVLRMHLTQPANDAMQPARPRLKSAR